MGTSLEGIQGMRQLKGGDCSYNDLAQCEEGDTEAQTGLTMGLRLHDKEVTWGGDPHSVARTHTLPHTSRKGRLGL